MKDRARSQKIEHVPDSRLFCVATADNLDFTLDEYDHVQECATCLQRWQQYLDRAPVHEDVAEAVVSLKAR